MKVLTATVGFVLALVIGGTALAAGPEVKGPAFSTRQEYRACLQFEERLQAQRKNLDDHVAENNNALALLQAAAMALAEAHKNTSPYDQSQVNDFNNQTEEHNRKIMAANEQAERVKAEYAAYNSETIEYNKKCATLMVRLDDRDAVLNERKETMKTPEADCQDGVLSNCADTQDRPVTLWGRADSAAAR